MRIVPFDRLRAARSCRGADCRLWVRLRIGWNCRGSRHLHRHRRRAAHESPQSSVDAGHTRHAASDISHRCRHHGSGHLTTCLVTGTGRARGSGAAQTATTCNRIGCRSIRPATADCSTPPLMAASWDGERRMTRRDSAERAMASEGGGSWVRICPQNGGLARCRFADEVIGERVVHLGHFVLGHVATDASLGRHRTDLDNR